MAQAPTTSSSGSGKGGSSGSSKGGKSKGKGVDSSSILALANTVPAHHAHHAHSGVYDTKGKFGNWPDEMSAFGEQ